MKNLDVKIIPVHNSKKPQLAAKFQFYVDLGAGLILQCINGQIIRGTSQSDRLYVSYPKTVTARGMVSGTWLFVDRGQQAFDELILSKFAEYQNLEGTSVEREEHSEVCK